MNSWMETLGVLLLAGAGVWLGHRSSRLPKPYWLLGYFLPLLCVLAIGMARWLDVLAFAPPFSWLVTGRTEYVLAGIVTTMVLTTPLSRVPSRRSRVMIALFMAILVVTIAGEVFLAPAFIRHQMARLVTYMDRDGVCLQGTAFNCGPAAAVTVLRRLGLPAEEGQIAIFAHTSPSSGTQPDVLSDALQRLYAPSGLTAQYRYFEAVAELRNAGPTIAVIKFAFLVDHYVAVLEVTDKEIILGDPLWGKRKLTHDEFKKIWCFSGVVLKRKP